MGSKTKKVRAAGRFGAGYGTLVRKKLNEVEALQRKRQICTQCSRAGVVREAAGIWYCPKCKKRYASHAYVLGK